MFGTNSTAADFKPHPFEKRVRQYRQQAIPKIVISREAFAKMWLYVDIAQEEVGWMGTAIRRPNGDFYIPQVWLLKQEVTGVETVLSNEGLSEMAMELLERGDEGMKDWDNLRFWGHSHVRMGTRPSGTDERTMVMLEEAEHPWFIRGILNKLGRIEFSIFLYESNTVIEDAPWTVEEPAPAASAPAASAPANSAPAAVAPACEGEKVAQPTATTATAGPTVGSTPPAKQPWYATVLGLASPLFTADSTPTLREEVEREFKAKVKSRSWIQRALTPAAVDGPQAAEAKSATPAAAKVEASTVATDGKGPEPAAPAPNLRAQSDASAPSRDAQSTTVKSDK